MGLELARGLRIAGPALPTARPRYPNSDHHIISLRFPSDNSDCTAVHFFLGSASEEEEKEDEEEEEEEKPAAANTHPPLRRADSEELLREQFNKGKI